MVKSHPLSLHLSQPVKSVVVEVEAKLKTRKVVMRSELILSQGLCNWAP